MSSLTILHTSDWHIGHQLYRKRREREFEAFLDWLTEVIAGQAVDILIIAGDIFDTPTPGATAQKLYYDFLRKASEAGIRHVVITAGNHDSPAFLTAARELLRRLHIHVVGQITENIEDEILELTDKGGKTELIVCAAPFLRERDMRDSEPGESYEDKERKIALNVGAHYKALADMALEKRQALGRWIPIVAIGHLHAAGAVTGAGVRPLYVGNLGRLPKDIFPGTFDYVALGHFHKPQELAGNIRYSGSPMPMSFDEAEHDKEIVLLKFNEDNTPRIERVKVPSFRRLVTIKGNKKDILERLERLRASIPPSDEEVWIEIQHAGNDLAGDLCQAAQDIARDSPLQILCVKTERRGAVPGVSSDPRDLREMEPENLFLNLMEREKTPPEARKELLGAFQELLAQWHADEKQG